MALTAKQEKFCLVYHITGNASEAYRQSYDCGKSNEQTINNEAYELKNNPDVAIRIEQLRQEDRDSAKVTIDTLTKELELARKGSMFTAQYSAAVAASMGKAKIHGLLIDKIDGNIKVDAASAILAARRRVKKDDQS